MTNFICGSYAYANLKKSHFNKNPVFYNSSKYPSPLLSERMRRPVGKMTMTEQKLEGEFRYVNSRIITNRSVLVPLIQILVFNIPPCVFSSFRALGGGVIYLRGMN